MLSHFNRVCLFATLWTVACQAPLSTGFSRQEYWNGLPCPAPGDIPNPGIEPMSLTSPALAGGFFTTSATWKAWSYVSVCVCVLSVCMCTHAQSLSHVWLCATLWTVAYQAPLSMEFFRQGYWSGLPFPPLRCLPNPGIKPKSPALPLSHWESPCQYT